MNFAIVDIETTGGSPATEKITEIAIYIHDGTRIIDQYVSLVNPERNIPYFITSLTGITNEMVEDAPKFYEIAKKVVEITEGATFVAHNARFDYSFVRQEFKSLGFNYRRNVLDTVALSRKLIPGHRSYSLGNICKDLGIGINGRHRAAGDALATVRLFEILLEKNEETGAAMPGLIKNTKTSKLHPKLDSLKLAAIPEDPGVYYFYNEDGDLIYIGKSRNLAQRISTHLSNNSTSRAMEMRDSVADISWDCTGSELIALLKESTEIKLHKPRYNRAQRRTGYSWGIYQSKNEDGYLTFSVERVTGEVTPLTLFTSKERAKAKIESFLSLYNLCQKLCGLYESAGECFHHQVGICNGACCGIESAADYNERAGKVIDEFIFRGKNLLIVDKGRSENERSVVKILNGKYLGYGFFCIDDLGFGYQALHECIMPAADNRDIQIIIKGFLQRNKVEKIIEF